MQRAVLRCLQTIEEPCGSAGTVLLSLLREERLELLELPEGAVAAPGSRSLEDEHNSLINLQFVLPNAEMTLIHNTKIWINCDRTAAKTLQRTDEN